MALEFKEYVGTEMTDLGTVKQNAGAKGKVELIGKNLANGEKRVAVLITNATGQSAVVPCSKAVSDAFRAKQLSVGQLMGLHIMENAEGRAFVSLPAGAGSKIDITAAKVAAYTPEAVTTKYEELVAW